MKNSDLSPQETAVDDPYHVLLLHLTGSKPNKPRLKTPANLWRRSHRTEIEDEVNQQAKAARIPANKLAPLREKIASALYNELGDAEKQYWTQQAKQEYEIAFEKWDKGVNGSPLSSTKPADLQRSIQGLTQFMQPILDGICAATGWKATFIAGGPEPAHDGRLNVLSIHSGGTKGDINTNFGRSERDAYLNQVLPVFVNFLRKCYTPEECRALALRPEDGFESIANTAPETPNCSVYVTPLPSSWGPGVSSTNVDDPIRSSPPSTSASVPIESLTHVSAPIGPPDSATSPVRHSPQPSTRVSSPQCSVAVPLPQRCGPSPHLPADPNRFVSRGTQSSPPAVDIGHDDRPVVEKTRDSDVTPVKPRKRLPLAANDDEELQETRPGKRLRWTAPETPRQSSRKQKVRSTTAPSKVGCSAFKVTLQPRLPKSNRLLKGSECLDNGSVKLRAHQKPMSSSREGSENQESEKEDDDELEKENVPDWFSKSLRLFQSEQLGSVWVSLLKDWETFEVRRNYQESGCRPAVLDIWIARAQSTTWRPSLSDLEEYVGPFKAWWKSLQPEWKVVGGGLNGVHSLVAALFFWGIATKQDVAAKKDWQAATLNVTQVFKQFCK